jgi:hypothetical protein
MRAGTQDSSAVSEEVKVLAGGFLDESIYHEHA